MEGKIGDCPRIESIAHLRQVSSKYPNILSHPATVGLKHYDDLNERMPRQEASEILNVVRTALVAIGHQDLLCTACGSFRRGKSHCGDVDVLVRGGASDGAAQNILARLVETLSQPPTHAVHMSAAEPPAGFLTDHLVHVECYHDGHTYGTSAAYMGVCRLSATHLHRRIDIKVYPREQYAFALLYFTGDAYYNRYRDYLPYTYRL
jgi:DNA polymerase lambda